MTSQGVSVAGEAGRGRWEGGKPKPSLRLQSARHCPRRHPPRGDDLVHRPGREVGAEWQGRSGVRRTAGCPPPPERSFSHQKVPLTPFSSRHPLLADRTCR